MKIAVAYIKGPRGFKGELAAVLYNPLSKSIKPGIELTLKKDDSSKNYTVEFTKLLRNRIGLKLEGIDNQETAESWKGAEILIEKDKLEPLTESEFYHFELEGMEVFDEEGMLIGTVNNVDSNTGNNILYVRTEDGEILIPFVNEIVKSINMDEKKIVVNKLEGLF